MGPRMVSGEIDDVKKPTYIMKTRFILRAMVVLAVAIVGAANGYTQESAEQVLQDKEILDMRGSLPRFFGGNEGLVKFLSENLNYPDEAYNAGVGGTVLIQLKVEKTGKVSNVKVLRSVSPELDEEALRVCNMLPDFIPAYVNGEPVAVMHVLPINFKAPVTKTPASE